MLYNWQKLKEYVTNCNYHSVDVDVILLYIIGFMSKTRLNRYRASKSVKFGGQIDFDVGNHFRRGAK